MIGYNPWVRNPEGVMKTKKSAIVLAVGLWAVLGALVLNIAQDARAEARLVRVQALFGQVLYEENQLIWGQGGLLRWEEDRRRYARMFYPVIF